MISNLYVALAVCIFLALFAGKIVRFVKLPNVTGYLIIGLLAGPHFLNIVSEQLVESLGIVPEVALGFIALSIGAEFKLSYLKQVGKAPIIIAFMEGFGATLVVDAILILLGFDVAFSIVLGAIAAATAPAATLMVVRQYKAKGPVTRTLLPVVAIDDAVALIAFGVSVAIAKAIQNPATTSMVAALASPLLELVAVFILGFVLGIVYSFACKIFKNKENRLCISIAMVFVSLGLCSLFNLSSLLCCMVMSAVYINTSDTYTQVFETIDTLTAPIFMLFFFLSGAELDVSVIASVGVIGIIYVVFRVIGKVSGAWLGSKVSKAEPVVQKYLGFTLIPQAGVAIGLATTSMTVVPEFGPQIRTIVLCGTVIYELIGPVATKLALRKAGEIE